MRVKLCKASSLPSVTSPYLHLDVTYAVFVVCHTKQLSACSIRFLNSSVYFQHLCQVHVMEKNVAIRFVRNAMRA
jgi:hypothetical protein